MPRTLTRLTGGAAHTVLRRLPWPTGTSRASRPGLRILLSLPCVPPLGAKRCPISNLPAVVVALPWWPEARLSSSTIHGSSDAYYQRPAADFLAVAGSCRLHSKDLHGQDGR